MEKRSGGRLRFLECRTEGLANDRVRARVRLAGADDVTVTGSAEHDRARDGDLWCVAEATVDALRQAMDFGPDTLWLKELVAFEMSDGPSVAVSLRATIDGQKRRLFGLNQIQEDRGRAAVLAVLSATNRFFGT